MNPDTSRDALLLAESLADVLENEDPGLVRAASARRRKGPRDLALLLSRGGDEIIEELARTANGITLRRFGKTIQLYIPLYVSNRCIGRCPYCGFRGDMKISRENLSLDRVEEEARAIAAMNMRHILLVSGDDPRGVDAAFLAEAIRRLKRFMHSVAVEVPPMGVDEYRLLVEAGLDGVTLYQESYDREIYHAVHGEGPKGDFDHRLDTMDRAGEAGVNVLTAGALWGLAPWRMEALKTGLHAAALEKRWWRSNIQIGLPRLKQVPDSFEIPHPVDDRSLVRVMIAMRIYLEEVGLVLSTREPPALRDALLPLGVTQMSAGSSTRPGGYSTRDDLGDQFEVVDGRSPGDMARFLTERGYDPVWKDWDRGIKGDDHA